MITSQEKTALLSWNEKVLNKINLTLLCSDDNEQSEYLKEFCSTLTALLPNFVVKEQKTEDDKLPAILIGDRLRYHAVPLGPELAPFMDAVVLQETLPQNPPEPINKLVAELDILTFLRLYISPQCPFCPDVVRTLSILPLACELIHLSIIDGTMFPEMAEIDGIKSAPTLMFDEFRWTGSIKLEEIIDTILNRDPSELSSSTIRKLIEEGAASQVAQLMLSHQIIFPGLVDLLMDEKWPVRLGAMVVIEELNDYDPALAFQVIGPLVERIDKLNDQAKGDVLYLIGETGTMDTVPLLERVFNDSEDEEIKTIAKEAIESIRARQTKNSGS